MVAARAVIDGTLDPSDPSAIAAQDFVKEQRKPVEDEIKRLKKLDSKPNKDQLAETESKIAEIDAVQKTNRETQKALKKVAWAEGVPVNKKEGKKARKLAYDAAVREAEISEGRELSDVEKTHIGVGVDSDMQENGLAA